MQMQICQLVLALLQYSGGANACLRTSAFEGVWKEACGRSKTSGLELHKGWESGVGCLPSLVGEQRSSLLFWWLELLQASLQPEQPSSPSLLLSLSPSLFLSLSLGHVLSHFPDRLHPYPPHQRMPCLGPPLQPQPLGRRPSALLSPHAHCIERKQNKTVCADCNMDMT